MRTLSYSIKYETSAGILPPTKGNVSIGSLKNNNGNSCAKNIFFSVSVILQMINKKDEGYVCG